MSLGQSRPQTRRPEEQRDEACFKQHAVGLVSGKILGMLCLLVLILYGAYYLLSPWIEARELRRVDPRLNLVPVNLPIETKAPLSDSTLEGFGFTFLLPKAATSRNFGKMTVVRFREGLMSFEDDTSRDTNGWPLILVGTEGKHAQRLLGQELVQSRFKLTQAAISTTPDQVKWWKFRSSQNQRAEVLLLAKFFAITSSFTADSFTISPIYTISAGELRGFQLGNPNLPPYEAHLDLFDARDRHFALDVTGPKGHGRVLSQEEINSTVASIRPISDH